MDLTKYNEELCINPVGFVNNGVICYFNSMLQSLLSCTSFIEKVLCENDNNPVIKCLNYDTRSKKLNMTLTAFTSTHRQTSTFIPKRH